MLTYSFTKLLLPHSYKIMSLMDNKAFNIINKKYVIGNICYQLKDNQIYYSNLYLEYNDRVRINIITETLENNKYHLVINNLKVRDPNHINKWNIYQMIEYDLLNIKCNN